MGKNILKLLFYANKKYLIGSFYQFLISLNVFSMKCNYRACVFSFITEA